MKPLKLILTSSLVLLGVLACDPIKGTLQVVKPFTALAGDSNDEEGLKNVTVDAGSYSMKLEMSGKHSAEMKLKSGRQEFVLSLQIPKGKEIPQNGAFALSAKESGQPFDLSGENKTTVTESDQERGQESCQEQVRERVCGYRGNPPQYVCWDEIRYRQGWMDVEYYFRTTRQEMTAQIQQNAELTASFAGARSSDEKIYTYRGFCRGYGF